MTARQVLNAQLVVDCGEGRASGRGSFTYTRPPRARYDCHRCGTREGPVTGPDAVIRFVAEIRSAHRDRCTAQEHRT
ncbi:hypothetical protein [Streptomyces sp. NPDC051569]|uniref:hypothetical protein n=1 Tax=Streptomyces sp. NPDC051569 TaxID=3365661 RepID=UPI00378B64B4